MAATRTLNIAGLPVCWREFQAPDGTVAFGLWVPEDPDTLLDELDDEEFQRTDERMPYFGHIWPAAEALVAFLLAGPRLDDAHVLDLGCGVGACGFAAAHQGARVTFFDWEPRALEIVQASAHDQRLNPRRLRFAVGDWRTPPPLGPFDLILGADLLYEARNAEPVAPFIATHLRSGGQALIADPGRLHAEPFPTLAAAVGLRVIGGSFGDSEPARFNFWQLQLP